MPIWFGYTPDKNFPLGEEIRFAMKHFDFLELTPPLESFTDAEFAQVRDTLGSFPVVGHLHWDLDFLSGGDRHLLFAKKSIAQLAVL